MKRRKLTVLLQNRHHLTLFRSIAWPQDATTALLPYRQSSKWDGQVYEREAAMRSAVEDLCAVFSLSLALTGRWSAGVRLLSSELGTHETGQARLWPWLEPLFGLLQKALEFFPAPSAAESVSWNVYRGTSLIRKLTPLGPYSRTMPRGLWWS